MQTNSLLVIIEGATKTLSLHSADPHDDMLVKLFSPDLIDSIFFRCISVHEQLCYWPLCLKLTLP